MAKKRQPKPAEWPTKPAWPEVQPDTIPEQPSLPGEEPGTLPEEDPSQPAPGEIPLPSPGLLLKTSQAFVPLST